MAKSTDAARLEEVKTLLHQLQKIGSEPGSGLRREAGSGHAITRLEDASPKRRIKSLILGGAVLLLLMGAATGAWVLFGERVRQDRQPQAAVKQLVAVEPLPIPASAPEPALEAGAALSLLREAQQMMLGGDISGARAILMQSADAGPPDVALALARSYDPNFLRSVTNPNAAPDIEQATLWYRRWHNAAVQNGQITDTLRLDRILRSMQ